MKAENKSEEKPQRQVGYDELLMELKQKADSVQPGDQNFATKFNNGLLDFCHKNRVRDAYIEKKRVRIRARGKIIELDLGDFWEKKFIPGRDSIISRFKIMLKMDISERSKPQKGRMLYNNIDHRGQTIPAGGSGEYEEIVIRFLYRDNSEKSIEELMFSKIALERVRYFFENNPYGLILVAGPTGSGKTTTMNALISERVTAVNTKVVTIEDPIEVVMDEITQVPINKAKGVTFETILPVFLRSGPDIIVGGEVHDKKTADMVIEAALTGHFVFATIHTNNAAATISRLRTLNADPTTLFDTPICILAQRLLPITCPHCKEEYDPPESEWQKIWRDKKPDYKFYRGKGCSLCAYVETSGVMAIAETMIVNKNIKRAAQEGYPLDVIGKLAVQSGMETMFQSGLKMIKTGLTTINNVHRILLSDSEDDSTMPLELTIEQKGGELPARLGKPIIKVVRKDSLPNMEIEPATKKYFLKPITPQLKNEVPKSAPDESASEKSAPDNINPQKKEDLDKVSDSPPPLKILRRQDQFIFTAFPSVKEELQMFYETYLKRAKEYNLKEVMSQNYFGMMIKTMTREHQRANIIPSVFWIETKYIGGWKVDIMTYGLDRKPTKAWGPEKNSEDWVALSETSKSSCEETKPAPVGKVSPSSQRNPHLSSADKKPLWIIPRGSSKKNPSEANPNGETKRVPEKSSVKSSVKIPKESPQPSQKPPGDIQKIPERPQIKTPKKAVKQSPKETSERIIEKTPPEITKKPLIKSPRDTSQKPFGDTPNSPKSLIPEKKPIKIYFTGKPAGYGKLWDSYNLMCQEVRSISGVKKGFFELRIKTCYNAVMQSREVSLSQRQSGSFWVHLRPLLDKKEVEVWFEINYPIRVARVLPAPTGWNRVEKPKLNFVTSKIQGLEN